LSRLMDLINSRSQIATNLLMRGLGRSFENRSFENSPPKVLGDERT
jgi:hypothetical protein